MADNRASSRAVTSDAKAGSCTPATAMYPFDNPTMADVVLRTCDTVDFFVCKKILSFASPFFMDMFSLTQPASTASQGDARREPTESLDDLPIIPVPEDSKTLGYLLRICYPLVDPVLTEPTDIHDVLKAAIKYDMEQSVVVTKTALRDLRTSRPLQAYVIACRLGLEDEARAAAQHWKTTMPRVPVPGSREVYIAEWKETGVGLCYVPEMRHISAGAFYRLMRFVRTGILTTFCEPEIQPSVSSPAYSPSPLPNETAELVIHPDFNFDDADIILRSADQINFYVHKLILRLASSILKDAIDDCETNSNTVKLDGRAVLFVPEDSWTLSWLLRLCYPLADPLSVTPMAGAAHSAGSVLPATSARLTPASVMESALKYKVERAIAFAKHWLEKLVPISPIMVYCTAVHCGWVEEAGDAADRLVKHYYQIEDLYDAAMEDTPANFYHTLLQYHHKSIAAVSKMMEARTGYWPINYAYGLVWGPILDQGIVHAQAYGQGYRSNPLPSAPGLFQKSGELDAQIQSALLEIELC